MPISAIFSRMIVEKLIDLLSIFCVGIIASALFYPRHVFKYIAFISLVGIFFIIIFVVLICAFGSVFFRAANSALIFVKVSTLVREKILLVFHDIKKNLSIAAMIVPSVMTLLMWLSLYAGSYIVIAKLVGVPLTYYEALVVLFAGALGLMVPAAPSGVGTFHASVVSAFVMLGRPGSEGLVLGTAIHFLFLIAYAVPMLIVGGQWRLAPQSQGEK